MNLKNLIFFAVVALFSLQSCDNLTEEIRLEKDGSGTYQVYSDMVPMVTSMQSAFATEGEEMTAEEKEAILDEKLWKDAPPGIIDSIMDFSEKIPDSIKNDPKMAEYLAKTEGFMYGGKPKGYLNMGMRTSFKDADDFSKTVNTMNEIQKAQKGQPGMASFGEVKTDVKFKLRKNKFKRTTSILSKGDVDEKEMQMMRMFMSAGKFQTVVHTPKRIKRVKGEHFKSKTDFSATFEYDMLDAMLGNLNTDFEIQMVK